MKRLPGQSDLSDYVATGQFQHARRVLMKAGTQKLEIANLHRWLLRIAYLEGDQAAIEKETPLAEQENEASVRTTRREYAYATGRFKEADALGNTGGAANGAAPDPVRRAFAEDCGALLATESEASVALLHCGARERAVQRAEQSLANPNLDLADAPRLRAIAAMGRGEPQKAVEELAPRVRVDFPRYGYLATLSKAYMDLNQPAEAAKALRKMVSLRSNLFQISFPRMHVELARALKAAGDKAGAKKAYDAFFVLWINADPDIPLLINAQKEYSALQQAL